MNVRVAHCLLLWAVHFFPAAPRNPLRVLSKESKTDNQQDSCTNLTLCKDNGAICVQPCSPSFHGETSFVCEDRKWQMFTDSCASLDVQSLFQRISEHDLLPSSEGHIGIAGGHLPFVGKGKPVHGKPGDGAKYFGADDHGNSNCQADFSCIIPDILSSPAIPGNIADIVELLKKISLLLSENVNRGKMQSYSRIANHILNSSTISNWAFVKDKNASSVLLDSVNLFAGKLLLGNGSESVQEHFISTKGYSIHKNTSGKSFDFNMEFNDTGNITGHVVIPEEELLKLPKTSKAISIAFPTLGAIMERNRLDAVFVNGMVLSVSLPEELRHVLLTFEKVNKLENVKAQCVGWHSTERQWDNRACQMKSDNISSVVCICRHHRRTFKSFSILMSPSTPRNAVLDYITCVGLGLSIFSLVVCLAVEAVVWHHVTKTEITYMRHFCLVNIATSLLIADLLFILAAIFVHSTALNYQLCVAATFFLHFFYLALFFWMFTLGLLILYGLLLIFLKITRSVFIVAAFFIGYGCPLVISILTVAITEPKNGYLRIGACWLNWHETKALLAFVIPALSIILVNMVVVVVVVVKTGRSSVGEGCKSQDLSNMIRISKNVALLTPLLGLTWGFGLATIVDSHSLAFHITFALLNAFQGLFILLFGTLLDRKTREALRMSCLSSKRKCSLAKISFGAKTGMVSHCQFSLDHGKIKLFPCFSPVYSSILISVLKAAEYLASLEGPSSGQLSSVDLVSERKGAVLTQKSWFEMNRSG
ncbi:adhesion G-protein coupled receptor F2-like [Indicator indicator]|uniref:adhesion G-protein coupled receptor F2-like n=1 Tax=Indicator indicator TaxID=1002788 RepID=UPI0023DE9C50|nr:adhesion G-protein coupled receptor F2-like [Indicator indicator]